MSGPARAEKPRQKRAQVTRDQICEATIRLLGSGGAKAVTHRAVADLAHVSLASTTYHFRDKAELLTHAFEWLIEHFISQSRVRLESALQADETIEGLTKHVINVSRQGMATASDRELISAWYEFMLEASRDPQLQPTAQKWYDDTCAHYEEILARFGARAPREDTRRLVDFLIGYEFLTLAIRPRKLGSGNAADTYSRLIESMFDDD